MSYTSFPTIDSVTSKSLPGPSKFTPTLLYKIKESKLGDGYTQGVPDGINFKSISWQLSWDPLWSSELQTIKSFLDSRGGYQTFLWTNPEDSLVYKVKCKEINYEWQKAGVWSLSVKFEQAFL